MRIGQLLRIGGAIALLVAGLVHLDLYFGGYRSAGTVPGFGRSIMFDAIAFGVVAVAVAARREWYVRGAGIALALGTLAGFWYTHSGHTMLGFESDGLEPSPQAAIALVAEILAVVLIAATFIPSIAASDEPAGTAVVAGAAAVAAVAFVGFGIYWANSYETTTAAAGGPASVTIIDFTFTPQSLTVPAGSTVTWTNNDSLEHSIQAADKGFVGPAIGQGASYQVKFDAPGDYPYICGIHNRMTGTITVTP